MGEGGNQRMRPTLAHLDKFRAPHPQNGHMGGPRFGYFRMPSPSTALQGTKRLLIVIACDDSPADGVDWEHVSVHGVTVVPGNFMNYTPSWLEMCWIKDQFFEPHECVMQLHVPTAEHINTHAHTLHLWRPTKAEIPRPPQILV